MNLQPGSREQPERESRGEHPQSYRLALAGGMAWSLVPTPAAEPWVGKLARTMGLRPSHRVASPRLLYCRGDLAFSRGRISGEGGIPDCWENLPAMGWRQEREGVFMTWHHPGTKDVILDLGDDSDEVLRGIPLGSALLPVYRRLIAGGGLLLHAALVEYRGCGCLLAASGGRGKSTCARRLPPPWRMASDDAALLVPTGNGYRVHPFPTWSELLHTSSPISWKVEEHFPVSAVFFLEQSPCRDQAVPLGQAQGTVSLYHSAAEAYGIPAVRSKPRWQHRELSAGIFRNAGHIARTVPCLLLKVRRDGTFWEEMERVLRGDAGFPGDRKRYD